MDNFAEAEMTSGERIRIDNEGLAVWTGYPSEETAWFDSHQGRIVVKNPDEAMRKKMFEIAQAFEARVQGDEGEFYASDGEPEREPPYSSPPAKPGRFKRLFGSN